MKILVTGGTGFIGRRLMKELVAQDSVNEVYAISRKRSYYPHPKVKVITADLIEPEALDNIPVDIDKVIHLAGDYNFLSTASQNYFANVIGTKNVLEWMRTRAKNAVLYYASSYAALLGQWQNEEGEAVINVLPNKKASYAYTKAIADQMITQSGLPAVIYRLGIVVGDSENGQFDRVDGPYYILDILSKLKALSIPRFVKPILPFPADALSFLPFVPVDSVVRTFIKGINDQPPSETSIYGVYNHQSISVGEAMNAMLEHLDLRVAPLYLPPLPQKMLKFQESVLKIPADLFNFCYGPNNLSNPKYQAQYGNLVPHFFDYKQQFFEGYKNSKGKVIDEAV